MTPCWWGGAKVAEEEGRRKARILTAHCVVCSRALGEVGARGEDPGDQSQVLLARLVLRKSVRFVLQLDGPRVGL